MINKFSVLNAAEYFSSGIFQNYLVFIPAKKYIKYFSTSRINSSKSNGISEENIENITKSGSLFALTSTDHHVLPDINFNGHCFINNNTSIPKKINTYISYIHQWPRDLVPGFTLGSRWFRSVKLTKNAVATA